MFPNEHPVQACIQDLKGLHLYPSNLSRVFILLSSQSVDDPQQT